MEIVLLDTGAATYFRFLGWKDMNKRFLTMTLIERSYIYLRFNMHLTPNVDTAPNLENGRMTTKSSYNSVKFFVIYSKEGVHYKKVHI